MEKDKIKDILSKYYKGSDRQIVFWYDPSQDYKEVVSSLQLGKTKIHCLTGSNYLATKILLEHKDPKSNYLVYAPFEKPELKDNWLADTVFYSQEFSPDIVAITCNELGVYDVSIKHLIKKYASFFKSFDRIKKLKSLISELNETNLELAMMAVIVKGKSYPFEFTLQKVLIDYLKEGKDIISEFEKYGLTEKFWALTKDHYGYEDKEPTLKKLLTALLFTALKDGIKSCMPLTYEKFVCNEDKIHNCTVFISNWMNNKQTSDIYKEFALEFEKDLKVRKSIKSWKEIVYNYNDVDLFESFDREVILEITRSLLTSNNGYSNLSSIIRNRKSKYWYEEFKPIYEALEAAIDLFGFINKYPNGFSSTTAQDFIKLYASEYYQADQAYRRFYTAFDTITNPVLKELRQRVEDVYSNKFLEELNSVWMTRVEDEILNNWKIQDIKHQKDFYTNNVANSKVKTFVIISDALRYEVAQDLLGVLNKNIKGNGKLDFMLGVVPSYTRLGMASLLPHNTLSINSKGQVLVDDINSDSGNREKILKNYISESVTIGYKEFMQDIAPYRDTLREFTKNKVVYIYHDKIDAIGDTAKNEKDVFCAVQDAIKEILECVKTLVNNNVSYVLITADHGFLYKRDHLEEYNKLPVSQSDAIELKKRFVLTSQKVDQMGALTLDMSYILEKETDLKVCFPKGLHRFKTPGAGINFVHGGASLQEVVIPVIEFKYDKKKETKTVEVKITNRANKITNNKFTLNLFQLEKVSDQVLPRTLKAALWDVEQDKQISDEALILANIESENPKDREFKIILTLKSIDYDKNKDYYLKLEEDGMPYEEMPVRINLAFTNEFDF